MITLLRHRVIGAIPRIGQVDEKDLIYRLLAINPVDGVLYTCEVFNFDSSFGEEDSDAVLALGESHETSEQAIEAFNLDDFDPANYQDAGCDDPECETCSEG